MAKDPKVLFVGKDGPAWAVRAIPLEERRENWTAKLEPSRKDIDAADIVVMVKTTHDNVLQIIRELRKPILWDINDIYDVVFRHEDSRQRVGKIMAERDLRRIVSGVLNIYKPDGCIVYNEVMKHDFLQHISNVFNIPPHFRSNLRMKTEEELDFRSALFDGESRYLDDAFFDLIRPAATRVGLESLKVGYQTQIADNADLCFGYRPHNEASWLLTRWKPGIKMINALASGVPFVCQPELSYVEAAPRHGALFYYDAESLLDALLTCRYASYRTDVVRGAPAFRDQFGIDAILALYDEAFRHFV